MQEPKGIRADVRRLHRQLKDEPWFAGIEIIEHRGAETIHILVKDAIWAHMSITSSFPTLIG